MSDPGGPKAKRAGWVRLQADPEQYQRFLDAARELGCEENAERMEEVIKRAAKLSPERGRTKPAPPVDPEKAT